MAKVLQLAEFPLTEDGPEASSNCKITGRKSFSFQKRTYVHAYNVKMNILPLVVHHRAVEDMAEHHREQKCFYSRDPDMGKLLLLLPPSIQPAMHGS